MSESDPLNIAEILDEDGNLKFRFGRYLAADRTRWVRHGLFQAFHQNGQLATEGEYADGLEQGTWRDYHEDGQVAAEGQFREGKKVGIWRYWDANGAVEWNERLVEGKLAGREPSTLDSRFTGQGSTFRWHNALDLPIYCVVGARPVKAVSTPEGEMEILVYDWGTGEFVRDMSYLTRIVFPGVETDIVSEEEFKRQVADLRAQRRS